MFKTAIINCSSPLFRSRISAFPRSLLLCRFSGFPKSDPWNSCFRRPVVDDPCGVCSVFAGSDSAVERSRSRSRSTVMEFVKAAAQRGSAACDAVAVRVDKKSYSYKQIISSACSVSRLLCDSGINDTYTRDEHVDASQLQNGKSEKNCINGARIGIVAKPSAEFVAGLLGTWLCGGVAVPLAVSYPEAELLHVMNDSEVSVLLSSEEHQEPMKNVAAKCAAHFFLIPEVSNILSKSAIQDVSEYEEFCSDLEFQKEVDLTVTEGDDSALILYTSGTTGKPKGVLHTHKGIVAQVQILTEAWEYSSADQFLNCLPLHHVHGLFNALLAPLYAGSIVEFMSKFSVRGIWQRFRDSYPKTGSIPDDAITVFTGVPTIYTRLLQGYETMEPEVQSASSSAAHKLRLMMCGSSALPFPIMKQWEDITGHRLLERYGMTEFVMALSNPLRGDRRGGTVGKPLPHVEVKILLEDENGTDSGVGELCIKSPSLFKEYWKRPEVTRESFTDDGFFKTGDTVKLDKDGYYIILGRTNADIMKVGGYKLSALEIESVLLEHPDILECAVLGLPDKDYGEVVCAITVLQADAKIDPLEELKPAMTLKDIQLWSKERLAPYKIPTKLVVWDKLPRNAMGKVNKVELKKLLTNIP